MARSELPIVAVLAVAAVVGGAVGYASLPASPAEADAPTYTPMPTATSTPIRRLAITTGIVRQRPPQPGDRWGGCNSARAAGTAPLYRGEPGYREGMDGDGDGIACEPIP